MMSEHTEPDRYLNPDRAINPNKVDPVLGVSKAAAARIRARQALADAGIRSRTLWEGIDELADQRDDALDYVADAQMERDEWNRRLTVTEAALTLIAARGCETNTAGQCDSSRSPDARYGGDRTCASCVARAALADSREQKAAS